MAHSAQHIVFGTPSSMFVGNDSEAYQKFLEILKHHKVDQVDTARAYGQAEENFGLLKAAEQGFALDTKVTSFVPGAHTRENIHTSIALSLELLHVKKVHILYLHAPDRATPFEDTLRGINEVYHEGKFKIFGISNFTAAEVIQVLAIADKHGWVRPTVYQGNYNAITRLNETELFPLLRKEKIAFYAYSPLAGGFFSGATSKAQQAPGSRFDGTSFVGGLYQKFYFKDSYFKALEDYLEFIKKHNLSATEVPVRWLSHHSVLSRAHGDAIIVGASKPEHLEKNLIDLEKGPLPEEVLKFVNGLWEHVKADAPAYHF